MKIATFVSNWSRPKSLRDRKLLGGDQGIWTQFGQHMRRAENLRDRKLLERSKDLDAIWATCVTRGNTFQNFVIM